MTCVLFLRVLSVHRWSTASFTRARTQQKAKKLGRAVVWQGPIFYSACEDHDVSCLWCDEPSCPFTDFATCPSAVSNATSWEAGGGGGVDSFDAVMAAEGTHASRGAWMPDDKFSMCFVGRNALLRYVSSLVDFLFSPNAPMVTPNPKPQTLNPKPLTQWQPPSQEGP